MNATLAASLSSALDAAAQESSLGHGAALQLMVIGSELAPLVHAPDHASLPIPLRVGPVHLLQQALEHADSPHSSMRLLNDTLILLMYGMRIVRAIRPAEGQWTQRLQALRDQRARERQDLCAQADQVQRTWRCQRFPTHALPSVELQTEKFLIQEVQNRMNSGEAAQVPVAAVQVDEQQLANQIRSYAASLRLRVDARNLETQQLKERQTRERHQQAERAKKLVRMTLCMQSPHHLLIVTELYSSTIKRSEGMRTRVVDGTTWLHVCCAIKAIRTAKWSILQRCDGRRS